MSQQRDVDTREGIPVQTTQAVEDAQVILQPGSVITDGTVMDVRQ